MTNKNKIIDKTNKAIFLGKLVKIDKDKIHMLAPVTVRPKKDVRKFIDMIKEQYRKDKKNYDSWFVFKYKDIEVTAPESE